MCALKGEFGLNGCQATRGRADVIYVYRRRGEGERLAGIGKTERCMYMVIAHLLHVQIAHSPPPPPPPPFSPPPRARTLTHSVGGGGRLCDCVLEGGAKEMQYDSSNTNREFINLIAS